MRLPLRIDLAGGWLDVPRFAVPGAYVVNCAIAPLVQLTDDRASMVWPFEKPWVPCGSGLGTSAAWYMLQGQDVDALEAAAGCGWQDAAVIRAGGLCVWKSGDTPRLHHRDAAAVMLRGRIAIRWTGKSHNTSDIAKAKRSYARIAGASLWAKHAVLTGDFNELARAVDETYEIQIAEGMEELPVFDGGRRYVGVASKYCGAGWGGYAVYLFEDAELRADAISRYDCLMAVEPFNWFQPVGPTTVYINDKEYDMVLRESGA